MRKIITRILELITNPTTGKLSTSDTLVVVAFIVTSFALIYATVTQNLADWLYLGYLAAWVTQSQSSKYFSIKRDKQIKRDDEVTHVSDD